VICLDYRLVCGEMIADDQIFSVKSIAGLKNLVVTGIFC
jgi:hypothetical protein